MSFLQAKMIVAMIKAHLGSLAGTNANYTSSCFSRWGNIAAMGFSKADIMDMREDSEMYNIMDALKDNEDVMDESQVGQTGRPMKVHDITIVVKKMQNNSNPHDKIENFLSLLFFVV